MTRRDRKPPRPQDEPAPAIWTVIAVVAVLLWAAALVLIVTIDSAHAREAPPNASHAVQPAEPRAPS